MEVDSLPFHVVENGVCAESLIRRVPMPASDFAERYLPREFAHGALNILQSCNSGRPSAQRVDGKGHQLLDARLLCLSHDRSD